MSHAQPSKPRSPEQLAADAEAIARLQRMGTTAPKPRPGPSQLRAVPAFVPVIEKCEQHGDYPMNAQDASGTVRWFSPGCPKCARQASIARLMNRAAISPRFEACTFENYKATTPEQRLALDTCKAYAAGFEEHRATGRCLILRGNPGTGKNHLATAIARSVMLAGYTVMNATAFDVIRRIRETWRADAKETEADVIRAFADIDLLILDEVGRNHKAKDGSEPVELFHVIDQRYRYVRPSIIISNLDREGMREAVGAAAYDRLREGGAALVNFDWASARA